MHRLSCSGAQAWADAGGAGRGADGDAVVIGRESIASHCAAAVAVQRTHLVKSSQLLQPPWRHTSIAARQGRAKHGGGNVGTLMMHIANARSPSTD